MTRAGERTTKFAIGVDFGTDSARAILVDVSDGNVVAESSAAYPRWKQRLYCDPSASVYRQHPSDYAEVLESVLTEVVGQCPSPVNIVSIGVDATASSPCLADEHCTPLCLLPQFRDNPDAMFVLWKDHSSLEEAREIEALCAESEVNYAAHSGYKCSPEYTWCKVLHVLRRSPELSSAARMYIEETDYITGLLTSCDSPEKLKPSFCASKQMWAKAWGGFPPEDFFRKLDPVLVGILAGTPNRCHQSSEIAGMLNAEWTRRLGLREGVVVCVGNCDSCSGAVGAGVRKGRIVLNVGTSASYMAVMPSEEMGGRIIPGLSGQGEGSILEGYRGYETGLSAFGDIFSWFHNFLCWDGGTELGDMLDRLSAAAAALPLSDKSPVATCHFNGRRAPVTNNSIAAAVSGLRLSTTAPEFFRSLVEGAAFGSKECIDQLVENGVEISQVVAIGGIARKSPFVMQTLSDVLGYPILALDFKESCALGAAIHSAVACGLYPDVLSAQEAMSPRSGKTYEPDASKAAYYARRYGQYKEIAGLAERISQ